jgi:hypothetical protein
MELITNISSKVESLEEERIFNQMVKLETKRRVSKVKGASDFGIMTACYIDGDFVLNSEYELPEGYYEALEKA